MMAKNTGGRPRKDVVGNPKEAVAKPMLESQVENKLLKLKETKKPNTIPIDTINNKKNIKDETNSFEDFWKAYPRQTGIGAARQQFTNQIMLRAVDPEQMVKAAKAFARKHEDTEEQFIPKPSNFLSDQTYLDPDLQGSNEVDTSTWPEWKRMIATLIGEPEVHSWFTDAETEGNAVYVKNQFTAQWVENNYSAALAKTLGKQYKIKLLGDRA